MKKCTVWVFSVLAVIVLLMSISCDDSKSTAAVAMYGSLSASTSSVTSRTIEPIESAIICTSYKIYGSHSNGTDTFQQSFSSNSVIVENLLVGSWTVYIEGFNSDGTLIARSESQSVTIQPTQTTSASFSLSYLTSGTGSLNLTLRISSSDTAVAKVVFTVGEDTLVARKTETDNGEYYLFRSSATYSVGQYDILATLYDKNDNRIGMSLKEIAHIFNGLSSSKTWTYLGFTASPEFSPSFGIFTVPEQIYIMSATENAVIYYTTDGTEPTASSQVYSGPIWVSKNTTVKAFSSSNLLFPSPVTTAEYHLKAEVPVSNVSAGTYEEPKTVSLSTTTAGSSIFYTLDGSVPTMESIEYTGPFIVSNNTTVRAITINPDFDNSVVMNYEYHIKAATPTSSVVADAYDEPQSVILSCSTPNSLVYYTIDGTIPTNESLPYTGAITVSESQTIKAIAYADGYDPSPVFSEEIVIATEKVGAVSFSVSSGTYNENLSVELSSPAGTTIYYTTDGSDPTRASNLYTSAITVDSSTTIKAIAGKWGYLNSDPVSAEYVLKTKNPSMSVVEGRYQTAQSVTLYCDTAGASIYYTLDGSNPTTSSSLYNGAITISSSTTLKAVAKYADWDCSEIVSVTYQIDGLAGFRVTNPTHYSLSLETPDDWVEGEPVIEGVYAELNAVISPAYEGSVYSWKIDGVEATTMGNDDVGNTSTLYLGYANTDCFLTEGFHSISVEVDVGGKKLYQEQLVIVTKDATIGKQGGHFVVGGIGPAGGYVFYDCDADNTEGDPDGADNLMSSTCGWRFLEASPSSFYCRFGVKIDGLNKPMYVTGYSTYTEGWSKATSTGWAGKQNTEAIVNYYGDWVLTDTENSDVDYHYAAKVCNDYEYGGYSDWFMPSYNELMNIKKNLVLNGIGNYNADSENYYLSSSEFYSTSAYGAYIYALQFYSTSLKFESMFKKTKLGFVIPVRAF